MYLQLVPVVWIFLAGVILQKVAPHSLVSQPLIWILSLVCLLVHRPTKLIYAAIPVMFYIRHFQHGTVPWQEVLIGSLAAISFISLLAFLILKSSVKKELLYLILSFFIILSGFARFLFFNSNDFVGTIYLVGCFYILSLYWIIHDRDSLKTHSLLRTLPMIFHPWTIFFLHYIPLPKGPRELLQPVATVQKSQSLQDGLVSLRIGTLVLAACWWILPLFFDVRFLSLPIELQNINRLFDLSYADRWLWVLGQFFNLPVKMFAEALVCVGLLQISGFQIDYQRKNFLQMRYLSSVWGLFYYYFNEIVLKCFINPARGLLQSWLPRKVAIFSSVIVGIISFGMVFLTLQLQSGLHRRDLYEYLYRMGIRIPYLFLVAVLSLIGYGFAKHLKRSDKLSFAKIALTFLYVFIFGEIFILAVLTRTSNQPYWDFLRFHIQGW